MKKEGPLENATSKSVVIKRNMGKYDDIINLPHHVSKNHPQMSNYDRAAQFAPFAALVGFAEAITNSEITYKSRIELSEDRKEEIELSLQTLTKKIQNRPVIEVTYFVKQQGNLGNYVTYKGKLKKIDVINKKIIFTNNQSIYIKDIYNIKEDE